VFLVNKNDMALLGLIILALWQWCLLAKFERWSAREAFSNFELNGRVRQMSSQPKTGRKNLSQKR